MARGKKTGETDTVSDVSDGDFDSDDSMRANRPPKKKVVKKEQSKATKAAPIKKPKDDSAQMDEDEDDEQRGLAQDYDEEDLLNIRVPDAPVPCMAVEGGNRLMITDITVENFKSYYGTRRIGPFHQSFTSIIGPNGSGKSNVIDALLFVFGYKASKIRSKKVSVLIHSSSGKDDIPSCTVTINFQKIIDNPDGTFDVVPNTDFNVSRTAYRNNSSEYRMDGMRTSFKEVAVRLKRVGIDLIHNRFLILQGEVEQIAMMKPKAVNGGEDGMLEYLEDIIGSSRFKMPIEQVAAKLEKLQAERSHQIAKVNTANRDKEALDEPVQNQIQYMNWENEVAALQCKQLLHKKYKALDKVEALEPVQTALEGDMAKVTETLAEVTAKLKEKKDEGDKMTKQVAGLQSTIHKTTGELESVVQKDKKRQNDLNRINNELKKLEADVKKEQDKLEEVLKAPEDAKAKMEQLTANLDKHREELTKAQEMFDEKIPEYNKKTEADRAKKTKMEEEYSGIAAKLAKAEGDRKMAENELRNLMEEYEKKKTQLKTLEQSLATNQEKRDKDIEAEKKLRAEITKCEEERKAANEEMRTIDERTAHIKKRIAELAPLLTEKHQEAQTRQFANRITAAFENAVAKGHMQGYLGRIGDLGSVAPEVDRAISNNCGAKLDNYLVETGRAAAEGSEILKKLNMRTTFVALDRQQRLWRDIKAVQSEKNGLAPRLFNYIDCDDKYKPAFYYVTGGAYVLDDVKPALALYRKTWDETKRRITVMCRDGDMVNSAGAIVGGGQVKEGKMGTAKKPVARRSSVARDEEAAAKKAEEAVREKRDLDQEMMQLGQRRRELQAALEQLNPKLRRMSDELRQLVSSIKSSEERVRIQTAQRVEKEAELEKAKVDERDEQEKRETIERLQKERDEAAEESKNFKAKIKKIDNEMAKVYDDLVKPHESATATAREAIEKAEKDLGKQQAIINGADRNIAKQQTKVAEIEKDIEQKKEKAERLKGDEESFEATKKEKQEKMDECEKQKAELEVTLKTVRASTTELDKEEVALTKQQKELEEKLANVKSDVRGLMNGVKEHERQIAKLELNNIAELLFEIPADMQQASTARRFLMDGESDSDLDDFEEFMTHSPSKKKELAEAKRARKDEPMNKKRKVDEDDTITELTMDEEPMMKTVKIEGDGKKMDMDVVTASTVDEAPVEEEETEDSKEARRQQKLAASRHRKTLRQEALGRGEMPEWSRRHIMKMDQDAIHTELDTLEKRITTMKKQLQPHILADYKAKVEKLKAESELLARIKEKFALHRDLLENMRKDRLDEFMGGFESIATALRELYQMITLGGDASLELKDVIDPFLEGVQFMVRPPKKSWKQIENLSGGEKTLSSLALVFALHKYRPTPLYVMDEIDAALDFRNVSIIGHYIKDRTKNAQFIIISLRNNMFELADRLVGIYKVHDCTRNVVVDPKKVIEEAEQQPRDERVRRLMAANKIQTGDLN